MVVTLYTTYSNIKEFCILHPKCIYLIHMIRRINGDNFLKLYFTTETQCVACERETVF
jgi:hypothetical protein